MIFVEFDEAFLHIMFGDIAFQCFKRWLWYGGGHSAYAVYGFHMQVYNQYFFEYLEINRIYERN